MFKTTLIALLLVSSAAHAQYQKPSTYTQALHEARAVCNAIAPPDVSPTLNATCMQERMKDYIFDTKESQ